jgi:ketosteroid isomerase-like protein
VAIAALICGGFHSSPAPAIAQPEDRAEDHEQLIALRKQFTKALNERDFEALKPLVTDSLTLISISNEKITGIDELKAYWEKLFVGEDSVLESFTVAPEADDYTTFLSDSVGVAQGVSHDVLEFRQVGRRELTSRWTAIVEKIDGEWKVARIHISANVLENPVLDAKEFVGNLKAGGGALVGLLLGLVLGALLFRRSKQG